MTKRIRMYQAGAAIKTMAVLADELAARRYVYLWEKPMHPSALASMTYHTLVGFIGMGALRMAHFTPEYVASQRKESAE